MTFFDIPRNEGPQPDPMPSPHDDNKSNDWDEWEDEGAVTPIQDDEQLLHPGPAAPASAKKQPLRKLSTKLHIASRSSIHKPRRLKSRQRQKAQNAKAGIRVITDLPRFQRPPVQQPQKSPNTTKPKFVDLAALRALEGSPNSASVGTWNWLRRKKSIASSNHPHPPRAGPGQDLSPADGPIVIGIAMNPEALEGREISPHTAFIDTPVQFPPARAVAGPTITTTTTTTSPLTPSQMRSVWSPDTPSTATTISSRPASSIYSQMTGADQTRFASSTPVPPVPEVPAGYRQSRRNNLISIASEDDLDTGTPCTLFEEDGTLSPERARRLQRQPSLAATILTCSPQTAGSPRGWWDEHITSPTPTVPTPVAPLSPPEPSPGPASLVMAGALPLPTTSRQVVPLPQQQEQGSDDQQETRNGVDDLWGGAGGNQHPGVVEPARNCPSPQSVSTLRSGSTPIIRTPSPRRTPSPHAVPSRSGSPLLPLGSATMASSQSPLRRAETMADKAVILEEENEKPSEDPPPYSPPQRQNQAPVRYRAVFPPDHPLYNQFPPSPGPVSPGIVRSMTAQGALSMTEIPLTPAPQASAFNDRPAGTFVPHEHSIPADGPQNRVERERRRHEKEEIAARKMGGMWRGRCCIPASGCYGRPGREGRKRRRICLAVVTCVIVMIALGVSLGIMLSRKRLAPPPVEQSLFVNLTGFPPMPTGVLTVAGPDNSRSFDGCTAPSTLWSCELPKELHDSVSPYNPNQPTVAFQIQFDNNPGLHWHVPNGKPPTPNATESSGPSSSRRRAKRFAPGISPSPDPPSFEEMWFLGNTTDGIVSDDKAGEPTPFYISLLSSISQPVGSNIIEKRGSGLVTRQFGIELPPPDLKEDGTGAPARLLPEVRQQPIRLYDRGLPTEHYGFYTYFRRTIYLRSVTTLNRTGVIDDVPLDKEGGSRESEANFLVTWAETRFLMQIWTNSDATKGLLLKGDKPGIEDTANLTRPGTMPYPVTMKLDTHGGDPQKKFVWAWPINERQQIDTGSTKFLANDLSKGGTVVNLRSSKNPSFGGFDGGSGGCRCEWLNFVEKR